MLGRLDIVIFRFVNNTLANPVFDKLMPLVTKLGEGVVIFCLAVILMILCRKDKKLSGVLLLAGLTATYFGTDHLKGFFEVPRPFMSLDHVRLLATKVSGYSFPSGHATTAFMAAAIASRYFRSATAVWMGLAALVAFSRLYIGVHYASDVIFGALVGLLIGYILIKASDNNGKHLNSN